MSLDAAVRLFGEMTEHPESFPSEDRWKVQALLRAVGDECHPPALDPEDPTGWSDDLEEALDSAAVAAAHDTPLGWAVYEQLREEFQNAWHSFRYWAWKYQRREAECEELAERLKAAEAVGLDPEDRERLERVAEIMEEEARPTLARAVRNLASHQGGGEEKPGEVTVRMSGGTAIALRYILPIVSTGLEHADDGGETTATLEQAIEDIDRALPASLRGAIDSAEIAEFRMNAIDAQRAAGVRPRPACKCGHYQLDHPKQGPDCGPVAHPEGQVE